MSWEAIEERSADLNNNREVEAVKRFLAQFALSYEGNVDYTVLLVRQDTIIATGSLSGAVLRNIAVAEGWQGEGLTARVVTSLMREAARRGLFHYFVYTKPESASQFAALGFSEVGRAEPYAVLLESGMGTINSDLDRMDKAVKLLPPGPRAGLVVNCNPFTLGHKHIITAAAAENASVVVLVVSEDRSLFPFDVRLRLIREGLQEYPHVAVLPGGPYIISAATFPGYFTKGQDTETAQTRLDAVIYAQKIAPRLGITVRYVGEEPYCQITSAYNTALQEILPQHGIAVKVVPRCCSGGEIVSASTVREKLRQDDWDGIRKLVPDSTYQYLVSGEADAIIARIKQTASRH